MVNILALNGVHTAGKSTIGEMLEAEEGFNYYSEIAQEMIDEQGENWGKEGNHHFQAAIHKGETLRDRELLQNGYDHVVVETWHFGNLAHSMETAEQSLVKKQKEYIAALSQHTDVDIFAAFLNMPLENIWERSPHFEEGNKEVIRFYDDVRDNHFQLYNNNIDYIVVENEGEPEAYKEVREFAYEVLE